MSKQTNSHLIAQFGTLIFLLESACNELPEDSDEEDVFRTLPTRSELKKSIHRLQEANSKLADIAASPFKYLLPWGSGAHFKVTADEALHLFWRSAEGDFHWTAREREIQEIVAAIQSSVLEE